MQPFRSVTSVAAPLPEADLDTDIIFPARFLLLLDREGLGRHLFPERRHKPGAPPFVLDYLAAHEVAHLKEMNHSARFWRLVDGLTPDVGPAKAWLARHGAALHAVGA